MRQVTVLGWALAGGCFTYEGGKLDADTSAEGLGTTDPGSTDPGTTDPSTTDPGTTDLSSSDSGPSKPGGPDSGITETTPPPSILEELGVIMVLVPSGTYNQGCTAGQEGECSPDEEPASAIRLSRSFLVSETEVTQRQFTALMGYNQSSFDGDDHPVESVTWHEAAAFANTLSAGEGLGLCYLCTGSGALVECSPRGLVSIYACEGYRLPTEAEWEHAARCGQDWKYAGSDSLAGVGWYDENSRGRTQEVRAKLPNACGLYDLSGNVWEWLNDWYEADYFLRRPTTAPEGPDSATYRVAHGGSWSYAAAGSRVSNRYYGEPADPNNFLGFRVARTSH